MSLTKFVMQSSTLLRRIVKKVFIHYNLKFYPNFDAFILFGHIFFFFVFPLIQKKNIYIYLNLMILKYFNCLGLTFLFDYNISKDFFHWYFSSVTTISSGLFNGKLSKHWFVDKLEIFFSQLIRYANSFKGITTLNSFVRQKEIYATHSF